MWARPLVRASPRTTVLRRLQPVTRQFSSLGPQRARYERSGSGPKASPEGTRRKPSETWRFQVIGGISALGAVYYVAHLERVPETGRWRFMDMNPKVETEMASEMHSAILNDNQGKILPPNHPLTRHTRRVVERILAANNLGYLVVDDSHPPSPASEDIWNPDSRRHHIGMTDVPEVGGREWHLHVVNDDQTINASATFGNIIVYTGLLPICKDEQGLAGILSHEIGHVVARHASERYSSSKVFLAVASLLTALGLDYGLSWIITNYMLDLPNSRAMEYEADAIGIRLAANACYDPGAAARVLATLGQLEKQQGGGRFQVLHTHPTSERRVDRLAKQLPEAYALALRAASPACAGLQGHVDAFKSAFGFSGAPGDASAFEREQRRR